MGKELWRKKLGFRHFEFDVSVVCFASDFESVADLSSGKWSGQIYKLGGHLHIDSVLSHETDWTLQGSVIRQEI